jgi:Na+/H+ antiporter NhaC
MSLIPPVIVLTAGYLSRHIIFSLLCGIISAALIATDGNPLTGASLIVQKFWNNSDLWRLASWDLFWKSSNLFVLLFLIMLAIIITLVGYAGGAYAYARTASRSIKTPRAAQGASALLSLTLAIDDYFSSLTVGSVMQAVTDQFRIPRAKLAFLVDTLAAPLVILCPVSSWIASIVGFLGDNGISLTTSHETLVLADPFTVYLRSLPFLFYSIILVCSVIFIISRRVSFGPMHEQEVIAQRTGNLFGGKEPVAQVLRTAPERNMHSSQLIDFLFPVGFLIGSVISGLLYSGGYLIDAHRTLLTALQNAQAAPALFLGGIATLTATTVFYLVRKRIRIADITHLYRDGFQLMFSTTLMLLCAWTLGDILRDSLQTGQYVGSLIQASHLPLFVLPLVLFVASCLTAFAIGSSWATMAIFFPIAIPMVVSLMDVTTPAPLALLPILFPALGAVFSGAVAGHNSPISDTTLMSATSSGCYLVDHIQTKLGYTSIVLAATAAAFLVCGLTIPYGSAIAALSGIATGLLIALLVMTLLSYKATRSDRSHQ